MSHRSTLVLVDPKIRGMSRLCNQLEAVGALPTLASLREKLNSQNPSEVGVVVRAGRRLPCVPPLPL